MGLVLFSIPWLWGINMFISVGYTVKNMFTLTCCIAIEVLWEGKDLEDGNNAVNASNASLLREFIHSLVKEKSITIEVLGYNSLLVETEAFSLESRQTTLLFGLS